jgi:hypothetical protein
MKYEKNSTSDLLAHFWLQNKLVFLEARFVTEFLLQFVFGINGHVFSKHFSMGYCSTHW